MSLLDKIAEEMEIKRRANAQKAPIIQVIALPGTEQQRVLEGRGTAIIMEDTETTEIFLHGRTNSIAMVGAILKLCANYLEQPVLQQFFISELHKMWDQSSSSEHDLLVDLFDEGQE